MFFCWNQIQFQIGSFSPKRGAHESSEVGTGSPKCIKARLTVVENAQSKFCKARTVPYGICPKVDVELEEMEPRCLLSLLANV